MTDLNFERSLKIKAAQASSISTIVPTWWKEISKQSKTIASPGKLYAIGNYLVELTKNSLGDGKGDGKITAIFDDEKIKIVIDDLGSEEKEINLNVAGDYGMKESIEYFDIFTVESRGKMYEKNVRNMIEQTDGSDVYAGSKLTIIKYHVTPVDEYEEDYTAKRNFGQRM
ncbi:MAG: hypothetical protein PHW24_04765 [Candidatus Moranbacteria bacterium]|nr:hypothetical protein [Candidatus Moranbacteria bacterium]